MMNVPVAMSVPDGFLKVSWKCCHQVPVVLKAVCLLNVMADTSVAQAMRGARPRQYNAA